MDTLNQFGLFLLNFALGCLVGYITLTAIKIYFNTKKSIEQQHLDALDAKIHRIKQEVKGDMHYWFDFDNDQFIAQGRTMNEIREVLKARWSKHIFVLNDHAMLLGPDFDQVHIYNEKTDD